MTTHGRVQKAFSLLFIMMISFSISACSSKSSKSRNIAQELGTFGDPSDYPRPDARNDYRNEWSFDWPVDRARLTRGYKIKRRGRPHLGIDLAGPRGTPIYSSQSGRVIYAGRDFSGFGKMILVESGRGWATLYAHLDKILVSEGQRVRMGETIGLMGSTGRSTGPHLHFEIRKDKKPVDPLLYLPGGREASRKLASNHD